MHRRPFLVALVAAGTLPVPLAAHHGWQWASDEAFTLTGVIRDVRLGNPHGLMEVQDDSGALWTVELGQPWRHERAGVPDARLMPGAGIVLEGHRSADPAELRMKAERIVFDGVRYNLYPDRS